MKKCICLLLFLCFSFNVSGADVKLVNGYPTGFKYEDMYNHWGEYCAIKLAEKNILKGMEIKNKYYFCPDVYLTRSEFLVLLMSALDIDVSYAREIGNPFSDASEIPAWANLYVKAAYDMGIVEGNLENGKLYFRPFDTLTRIEIIKIIDKAVNPEISTKISKKYADMYLVPKWAETAVYNMTNYGILEGFEDNTIRPYVKINRAMAAQFVYKLLQYKESLSNIK